MRTTSRSKSFLEQSSGLTTVSKGVRHLLYTLLHPDGPKIDYNDVLPRCSSEPLSPEAESKVAIFLISLFFI